MDLKCVNKLSKAGLILMMILHPRPMQNEMIYIDNVSENLLLYPDRCDGFDILRKDDFVNVLSLDGFLIWSFMPA